MAEEPNETALMTVFVLGMRKNRKT